MDTISTINGTFVYVRRVSSFVFESPILLTLFGNTTSRILF